MEIDHSTIVMTIIFVIAIALPFYLISASIKRSKQQMKKRLEACGVTHHLNYSETEFCNSNSIGMDFQQRKIVFVKANTIREQEQIIDLHKVLSCKVEKSAVGKKQDDTYRLIKIDLCFRMKSDKIVTVPIFDVLYDDPVEGKHYLLIAEKWTAKIHELIKADHTLHAA